MLRQRERCACANTFRGKAEHARIHSARKLSMREYAPCESSACANTLRAKAKHARIRSARENPPGPVKVFELYPTLLYNKVGLEEQIPGSGRLMFAHTCRVSHVPNALRPHQEYCNTTRQESLRTRKVAKCALVTPSMLKCRKNRDAQKDWPNALRPHQRLAECAPVGYVTPRRTGQPRSARRE